MMKIHIWRMYFGILLILIGVSLFLTLSISPSEIFWSYFATYSPFILISIGFMLIFHRRIQWLSITGGILLLLVPFGIGVYYSFSQKAGIPALNENIVRLQKPFKEEIKELNVDFSAGSVVLDGDNETEKLVNSTLRYNNSYYNLSNEYSIKSEVASWVLKLHKKKLLGFVSLFHGTDFDLHVNSKVVLSLTMDVGTLKGNLDLSGGRFSKLYIDCGTIDLHIKLPDGDGKIYIDSGTSALYFEIPKGVGVKVKVDAGILSTKIPQDFYKRNKVYYSDNYKTAEKKLDLDIDSGTTRLVINR